MIRLGVPADLAAVTGVYRSASLSNARDRDQLLAHPDYLNMGPEGLAEGRTYVAEENGSVDAPQDRHRAGQPHHGRSPGTGRGVPGADRQSGRTGLLPAAGFIDCGVAETAAGSAPRMRLSLR
jgi:hypothetical protein